MSLAPQIDERVAEIIVNTRNAQAFRSLDAFVGLPMLAYVGIDRTGIAVDTEFFEVTTEVASRERETHMRATISRERNGATRVVSRRWGYFDD